jgi:excisionase family DNA binding protein
MIIDPDKYYTVQRAAEWLDCTPATVYGLIKKGKLRHQRVCKIRIKGAWLLDFRAKRTKGGENVSL